MEGRASAGLSSGLGKAEEAIEAAWVGPGPTTSSESRQVSESTCKSNAAPGHAVQRRAVQYYYHQEMPYLVGVGFWARGLQLLAPSIC
jgi:hypothetical protein